MSRKIDPSGKGSCRGGMWGPQAGFKKEVLDVPTKQIPTKNRETEPKREGKFPFKLAVRNQKKRNVSKPVFHTKNTMGG